MTDPATVVLYTLSTLAQTCAALAAFVGAVGLYKLQSLRDHHARNEQTLRGLYATATGVHQKAAQLTLDEILREAEVWATAPPGTLPALAENFRKALAERKSFRRRQRQAVNALLLFEGWHLLVIGAALIGFNYVESLAGQAGAFWALWVVAAGTVAVTGCCVFAWTRE